MMRSSLIFISLLTPREKRREDFEPTAPPNYEYGFLKTKRFKTNTLSRSPT